ncbi:hypothetical protein DQ04_02191060 [Trypanosoma grayi]|uniref:hypothetical protein n=1 Tax=Trypanosoma grayi TaxID=71804 RepID=UPI0004F47C3D|nr:hypothetical protein DQ04_02191060 [Trypanosoma grayi]KEG11874.1 hypothetical protein DQ04_02191060 [Trypanosoma grayi]
MKGGPPLKRSKISRDNEVPMRVQDTSVQEEGSASMHTSSPPLCPNGDRRVCLNVGGKCITTLASTLCSVPSLLSEWLNNGFAGLPRDRRGNPFIDRDPENFRLIVNYLRGYELPLDTEKIVFLAEDAEYYRIEALRALIDPPAEWHFESGPGVSPDKTHFSTDSILGTCGNDPLPSNGKSVLTLHIDKCELVTVGLIDAEYVCENKELQYQRSSIAYRNTGELVCSFNDERTYTMGVGFKSQDLVMVQVVLTPNAAAKIDFYCGSVKTHETEWPAPTPPLRFAVSLRGTSAVTIEKDSTTDVRGREGVSLGAPLQV